MNYFYAAILEIVRTGHSITDSVTRELKEYGIYEPQFNVLRILRGAKGQPLSVNQILERMITKSSNVTRIVDKLEAKGLVERTTCPADRRRMDIVITTAGLALLKKLDKKVEALHKPMAQNLSQQEAEQLVQLIHKLKGTQV